MKTLLKILNKRALCGLFSVVLVAILFTGCPKSTGANQPDTPADTSYNLKVKELHATWVQISFCTVDEMKNLNKFTYSLYQGDSTTPMYESTRRDKSDFYLDIIGSDYSSTPLTPNTKYKIKVVYTRDSDYSTFEKSLEFTTKEYDFSDYTLSYDDIYDAVSVNSDELPYENLLVTRSESADGEYVAVKGRNLSSSYIRYIDEDNLTSNKTYYYKFAITKYNSETKNYDVLYECKEPKSITLGVIPPGKVDESSIKIHQGITAVKFNWEPVAGASNYQVVIKKGLFSSTQVDSNTVTKPEYEFDAVKYGGDYSSSSTFKVYICAVNEAGSSDSVYKEFAVEDPKVKNVLISTGQKEAIFRYVTNFDYIASGCSVEYLLSTEITSSDVNDSNLIVPASTTPELKRTGLNIFTEYSSSAAGYAFVRAKYKDNEGKDKTVMSTFCSVGKFKTDEFDAVTDLEVLVEESVSVTIKFTPLTSEQKDGQNVRYWVTANGGTPKEVTTPSSYKITGLKSGVNYSLKVITTTDSYLTTSDVKDYKTYAEIEAATLSGLAKPTNIVLSEEEGALEIHPLLKVTWDPITQDTGTGNITYEVEYKNLAHYSYGKFVHKVGESYVNAYTNEYTATMPVNAGNRYLVRIVAYKTDEPDCKEYSLVEDIQLTKYNDRSLITALTYPAAVGNHQAGDVIDFTDPNVWEGGTFVPRSTNTSGYQFGITQFMGESSSDLIRIPTGNPAFFAFKISLDSGEDEDDWGINSGYAPRLIFLDDSAFWTAQGQSYGRLGNIYIITPEATGYIIETFPEENSSIFSDTKMPFFNLENGNLVSSTRPKNAGIEVLESWVYNNCVYIGVKQTVAGNVGFSYFY